MAYSRNIIFNGKLVPKEEAWLPAISRAVRYADGCFETLRVCKKGDTAHLLLPDAHLRRLRSGLHWLQIPMPKELKHANFRGLTARLLEANEQERDSILRIQVWREGGRGYRPTGNEPPGILITNEPLPEQKPSIRLATVPTKRIPAAALPPNIKWSGGTGYIRAAMEAEKQGADDAVMLTVDDVVSETTNANLFWLKEDAICTPDDSCDLLPGITRGILLGMDNYKYKTGRFPIEEVKQADAVWVCNSLKEIQAVSRLDELEFNPSHPTIRDIQKQFKQFREANLEAL